MDCSAEPIPSKGVWFFPGASYQQKNAGGRAAVSPQAQQALEQRGQAVQTRWAVLKKRAKTQASACPDLLAAAPTLPPVAQAFVAASGALPSASILVAEGESWFDYPGANRSSSVAAFTKPSSCRPPVVPTTSVPPVVLAQATMPALLAQARINPA